MDINIAKTKVMLFGTRSRDVIIKIKGLTLANVSSYRYLGVILDENLSFGLQVDNAVCKAKRTCTKIMSLIHGRRGISVQLGITLCKTLIRPHLEYAIAVWASIGDKELKKLDDVQVQSIRRIIGAKSHPSSSAIEVVSGIYPVNVHKREMCNREFIRIMSEDLSHPLRELMNTTTRSGLQFCPIKYIQTMSRELQRGLKDCEIETRNIIVAEDLVKPANIVSTDIHDIPEYNLYDTKEEDTVKDSTYNINLVIEKIT